MAKSTRRGRSRAQRAVRAVLWGMAAAHVVDATLLRRRRVQLRALSNPVAVPDLTGKLGVRSVVGGTVDGATLAAAAYEMDFDGVEVVDLVPGNLPVERSLRLLRRVIPDRLSGDVMYSPGGAHEALAVHPALVERLGYEPAQDTLDRATLVRATVKAQRYAPASAVVRVAPELRAAPYGPVERWRELEAVTAGAQPYASLPPLLVGMQLAHLAAMTAGLFVAPPAALAALATWSAQPALVFGTGAARPAADGESDEDVELRPPHVGWSSLLRLPLAWFDAVTTALAGVVETREAVQRRLAEPIPAAPPVEELFEDRRWSCPWCGSSSLTPRLDTTDLFQNKPGAFHLDECDVCGHIFQNPALSIAGLNYYYDEFYEGIGEEMWEVIFAGGVHHNRNRVASIDRQTVPKAWLDVGCGHGHFCLTARQRWPETRFDGVDMSETVQEAQRRGWIDIAHFGLFTELADDLPRIYDVVSMHHYLEHTRDPRPELAAAAKVLQPGGHLMIEVPDPATPWARRLGRFWFTWAQPQHLHFVKCEELTAELERMGFEVVSVERGAATLGLDLSGAVMFGVQNLAPSPHLPWLRRPPLGRRLRRLGVLAAAAPVFLAASIGDAVKDARPDPRRIGNAYRVVARAPGDG